MTFQTVVGAPNESTTANPRPVARSAARPATATSSPTPESGPSARAVGREPLDAIDRPLRSHDPHLVPRDGELSEHGRTFRDERLPGRRVRRAEGHHDHPSAGSVERRDTDQRAAVGGEVERRRDLDAGDDRRPHTGPAVEQVDVVAGPTDEHVDEQPPTVRRELDVGPRLRIGVFGPHDGVVAPGRAERVVVHRAVVLVAGGIARVREAAAVRVPGDAAGPRVRDGLAEVGAGRGVEDAQHRFLRPTFGGADGDQRAVVAGLEPVDGDGGVGGAGGRVEQGGGRRRCVGSGAPGEEELLGAGRALQGEEPIAADLHAHRHGQLQQLRQVVVPALPVGDVQDVTGDEVLRVDPARHLRRGAVLQPAVRVLHLDPVEDVDDVVTTGRRRRQRLSRGPCWGACRGWPWTGGAEPCASSSSSTWVGHATAAASRSDRLRRAARPRWRRPAWGPPGRPSG